MSPSREGLILPGSEPRYRREEGWKSFGNKTPGVGWEGKAAVSLLACVVRACPTDSHRVSLAPNPALPSCAAYPRHWGGRLCPCCCPLLITSVLEFHQKAVNWPKKGLKPAEGAEPGGCGQKAGQGCVANTMFARFRGDAGFRVILESVGVMARREIFRSVVTTTSAFCFILLSLFYCSLVQVLLSQKESVLEITGSIGTAGMRVQKERAQNQSVAQWN